MSEEARYPIGRVKLERQLAPERRRQLIEQVAAAPGIFREAVKDLSGMQLDTPYRLGGWTVRQLIHHLADSHMNAYVRFKLALTEDQPTIKPYDEERWAELADTPATPPRVSLDLLTFLHERWVILLRSMDEQHWQRSFYHPDQERLLTLDEALSMYAWHGAHHTAHVTALRERMGW